MRRFSLSSFFAAALVTAGLLLSPSVYAAENLRIAGNFGVEHSVSKAMEMFKEEVEKRVGKDVKISLFPNMMLGGADENVDQTRSGTIFGTFLSVAYMSRVVPDFEAVSIPFLIQSRDQAYELIDGEVGQMLDAELEKKGFHSLGYGELGFRNITNSVRPLKELSDLKNLKIRVQPNPVHLDAFRALGTNPVAMDISEVYSALQQGVLDGEENPYAIVATRRFDEVQKYLSDSKHVFDFVIFVANDKKFSSLDPRLQDAISEAATVALKWQREASASEDESWREELEKRGMEYTEMSSEAKAAMKEAMALVIEKVKARVNPELLDKVADN